jgi:hypothetical protein
MDRIKEIERYRQAQARLRGTDNPSKSSLALPLPKKLPAGLPGRVGGMMDGFYSTV